MGGAISDNAETPWGPAEAAAIDKCLSAPGLSSHSSVPNGSRLLARTIEAEIIPRLLLAHQEKSAKRPASEQPVFSPADIISFARVVIDPSSDGAPSYLEGVRAAGHSFQTILLDLLTPTARLLGEMWNEDLCTFTDVTIGMSRLQQALRVLETGYGEDSAAEIRGRILLAAVPGEQHSFGLSMLETFFRRDGWAVYGGSTYTPQELVRLARDEWLDVIGVSLSSDVLQGSFRDLVTQLKGASRNPKAVLIVGGRYFTNTSEHAIGFGADAVAHDARDALRIADAALSPKLTRSS